MITGARGEADGWKNTVRSEIEGTAVISLQDKLECFFRRTATHGRSSGFYFLWLVLEGSENHFILSISFLRVTEIWFSQTWHVLLVTASPIVSGSYI